MIKHGLNVKSKTVRLALLATGLLVGVLAFFFDQHITYPENYGMAVDRMDSIGNAYQSTIDGLIQKQDSMVSQISALDTLRDEKSKTFRTVLKELDDYTHSHWQQLSEKEKSEWTELAINSIYQ